MTALLQGGGMYSALFHPRGLDRGPETVQVTYVSGPGSQIGPLKVKAARLHAQALRSGLGILSPKLAACRFAPRHRTSYCLNSKRSHSLPSVPKRIAEPNG